MVDAAGEDVREAVGRLGAAGSLGLPSGLGSLLRGEGQAVTYIEVKEN